MAAPFNRKMLARIFRLPEDIDDAHLARKLRWVARGFRRFGLPFVLKRDLDVQEILAAFERRLKEEEDYIDRVDAKFYADMALLKARYEKQVRQSGSRLYWVKHILRRRDGFDR